MSTGWRHTGSTGQKNGGGSSKQSRRYPWKYTIKPHILLQSIICNQPPFFFRNKLLIQSTHTHVKRISIIQMKEQEQCKTRLSSPEASASFIRPAMTLCSDFLRIGSLSQRRLGDVKCTKQHLCSDYAGHHNVALTHCLQG